MLSCATTQLENRENISIRCEYPSLTHSIWDLDDDGHPNFHIFFEISTPNGALKDGVIDVVKQKSQLGRNLKSLEK